MSDITTETAASLKFNSEIFSLNPSAVINLFEVDVSSLMFDSGLVGNGIFRFHNNIKLGVQSIFWKRDENNHPIEYVPAPITADGFESNGRGTLATPKLSISVNDAGIPALSQLKQKLYQLGDLSGAKVTRIRTFAKYLNVENFFGQELPKGFEEDTNLEFPRDVFYIDRKTNENKSFVEYQLASILDVEGLKLPGRIVSATKCTWQYRGPGCAYEYRSRIHTDGIHEGSSGVLNAPPKADENDRLILDILRPLIAGGRVTISDYGLYNSDISYPIGASVFIEKNQIKYYFVAIVLNPPSPPPNLIYWIQDTCSHIIKGCKIRYPSGPLPFGGYPGLNRMNY